jgi:hypothetical protein
MSTNLRRRLWRPLSRKVVQTMNKLDKVLSLQAYIQKLQSQSGNIPERRQHQKEAYLEWIGIEIKKAKAKIEKLS